ncbi:hypothetical protein HF521_001203 [Silurus meridionalis]|uniref:Dilute domain-containing protein n=4 Tax=Silurus meridionalis TaxID=175797 RepID=A0A8T0B6A6_SILME|nr:hypothetical protein HF521_001203 [Silurus meridionalis]
MRQAAIIIQQYIRGKRQIRRMVTAAALKQGWAAVIIQKHCRGYLVRRLYQLVLVATVTIQAYTRGCIARKRYRKMVEEHTALVIQKYARAWLVRRRFQTIRRLVINVQLSYRVQQLRKKLEEQSKENRGLMERLTSLANAHAQGLEKVQSLEVELSKAANEKLSMEEREKKRKEETSQVIAQLQNERDKAKLENQALQAKLKDSIQQMTDHFEELKKKLLEDLEREERLRKVAEHSSELQKEDLDKEIEVLKNENRKLREAKIHLQAKAEEDTQINQELQEQLGQLTKHVRVIPELHREIHSLQNEKTEADRKLREQTEQTRAKMNMIARQLLGDTKEEETINRFTKETTEAADDKDLQFAFNGLQNATRLVEAHLREQREINESKLEALVFKNDHLTKENHQLQTLFQEKSDVNHSFGQEVARLTAENMVIPELKQQVTELQRHRQELETQLEEQRHEMTENNIRVSNELQHKLEEEGSQRRLLEKRNRESEREREKMDKRLEEFEETIEQLKRHQQTDNETKNKLRQETSRLTAENMEFEEQLDTKDRTIKRLQDQIKALQAPGKVSEKAGPVIPKEYLGMLEYRKEDEGRLVRALILELKPRGVVVNMIPGLASYLLFMCVRHSDYLNDGEKLKSLMQAIISGIKQVTMDHQENFEVLSFWLSNTYYLLNCLKQYSGEEEFIKHNTPRQNKNCLQNFDLSEYRQVFSDLAIHIHDQFLDAMEDALFPMIVPGMLEHESLQGISSMKPTGFRKRSNSMLGDGFIEGEGQNYSVSSILQLLSDYHSCMAQQGMDPQLQGQALRQLFYLIGATSLNSILLRKDLCSCRKGMQIRCNISYLEEWLRDKGLQGYNIMETLGPLSQAAWLLQVNKTTDDDAAEIQQRCHELSPVQIVKILNSYTPIDDFEKRVAPSFVRKVQALLQEREGSAQLMMDAQYRFQVTFPFCSSTQALELLQVPNSLHLSFVTLI